MAENTGEEVVSNRTLQEFDFVPVRSGRKIVGLLDRARLIETAQAERDRRVADLLHRLDESNLMSADDGILTFVETADKSPCRLLLDRGRVAGIVTISDLQRLPVRPALFLLVTHVELLMAQMIRLNYQSSEDWLDKLPCERQKCVRKKYAELQRANLEIDLITATEFADKKTIVQQCTTLPVSKNKANRELNRIQWLRDHLAHAGDYANSRSNALKTIKAVRFCREWIGHLQSIAVETQSA